MGPGDAGLKLDVPPPAAVDEVIVTVAVPEMEDASTPIIVKPPIDALFQVPFDVVLVTALPPAVGVTDKADENGKLAFVPIKFNVPNQLPETVIATELLLLFGSGNTTHPEELPKPQLGAVVVILPVENCC